MNPTPEQHDALITEAWAIRPDGPYEGRGAASIAKELATALATERALRVKAEQRIADAPHDNGCGARRMTRDYVNLGQPCTCWKSDTPTAEQRDDQ